MGLASLTPTPTMWLLLRSTRNNATRLPPHCMGLTHCVPTNTSTQSSQQQWPPTRSCLPVTRLTICLTARYRLFLELYTTIRRAPTSLAIAYRSPPTHWLAILSPPSSSLVILGTT